MGADLCVSRPQGNFSDLRRPQLTYAVKWGWGRPSLGDAGKHDRLTLRLTLLVLCFKDLLFVFFFLFFWLWLVFIAACGLSPVAVSQGYSSLQYTGFSSRWLLSCCRAWALGYAGLSRSSMWARYLWFLGSSAQTQWLRHAGFVVPRHVGSSRTMD